MEESMVGRMMKHELAARVCREFAEESPRIILEFLDFIEVKSTTWGAVWDWLGRYLSEYTLVRVLWRLADTVERDSGMCRCVLCGTLVCEDESDNCQNCGRRCCNDCLRDDYRNFSYWDGNVDIVPVCVGYCTQEEPLGERGRDE